MFVQSQAAARLNRASARVHLAPSGFLKNQTCANPCLSASSFYQPKASHFPKQNPVLASTRHKTQRIHAGQRYAKKARGAWQANSIQARPNVEEVQGLILKQKDKEGKMNEAMESIYPEAVTAMCKSWPGAMTLRRVVSSIAHAGGPARKENWP